MVSVLGPHQSRPGATNALLRGAVGHLSAKRSGQPCAHDRANVTPSSRSTPARVLPRSASSPAAQGRSAPRGPHHRSRGGREPVPIRSARSRLTIRRSSFAARSSSRAIHRSSAASTSHGNERLQPLEAVERDHTGRCGRPRQSSFFFAGPLSVCNQIRVDWHHRVAGVYQAPRRASRSWSRAPPLPQRDPARSRRSARSVRRIDLGIVLDPGDARTPPRPVRPRATEMELLGPVDALNSSRHRPRLSGTNCEGTAPC